MLGDIASLGIGLGAMGGMINMTKRCNVSSYKAVYCKWDKMYLIQFSNLGIAYVENKGIVGNFCSMCEIKKIRTNSTRYMGLYMWE